MAVMSQRESLAFDSEIRSDTAALHGLVAAMLEAVPSSAEFGDSARGLRLLRDPTRGGLGATLNEIAAQSGVGIVIDERQLVVAPAVSAACEFLGLDPLYVANEGKLVAVCAASDAGRLLEAMRAHPLGRDAQAVGEVIEDRNRFVQMRTALGGSRIVDWLSGEQLPRIC
jgi:hydrogenase expression/formation protein HypE